MGRWQGAIRGAAGILAVVAGLGISASAALGATTWYVSAAPPAGTPDGSAAHPFPTIQEALDEALDGDTVLVDPGLYPESPVIARSVVLRSTAGRDGTTILLQQGAPNYGALTIAGPTVKVIGFTIVGFDAPNTAATDWASVNVFVDLTADDAEIAESRFVVGTYNPLDTDFYDGIGVLTAEDFTGTFPISRLVVRDSAFLLPAAPLNLQANSAFYISPGVGRFELLRNTVTGEFDFPSITLASQGLLEGNSVTGTGASGGLGAWSWDDPALYGRTTFRGNTVRATEDGIVLFSTNDTVLAGNDLRDNVRGVLLTGPIAGFDASTVRIHRNNLVGNGTGVQNSTGFAVDATCNWWGSDTGPGGEGPGTGDAASLDVVFSPWLVAPAPEGACGGTPRGLKQQARAALQALLPASSRRDDDLLRLAIRRITASLDARYWADDSTLTSRGGKVFGEERAAVGALLKVRGYPVLPQVLALVEADRALAATAIQKAVAEGRKASSIAKAQEYMAKATKDLARGAYEAAITDYEKSGDGSFRAPLPWRP